jgi:hypothetical protein
VLTYSLLEGAAASSPSVIVKVFYPVFAPDKSADEVVIWLQEIV